jgi:ribosome maturation factor RimP
VASDVPLRSARLPSQQQVIELLGGEFARAGFDIEDVVVDAVARPPRIVVVADGDEPPDLDSIAALSRSASELLDGLDDSEPYVLEVTSRGAESPLTSQRHYRRARGRKVAFELSDGERLTGRLGDLGDGSVAVVVPAARKGTFAIRDVALEEVVKAVVQVEFSAPSARELEMAGLSGKEADA